MIFLILAAQYEKWSLPFVVILSVPFAVLGALLAIYLRGIQNDLYFQVGLVTLIGLAAKNAILIVEFAVMEVQRGLTYAEAAVSAAKLRFRPIVMTSLAFTFGVLPLAISTGCRRRQPPCHRYRHDRRHDFVDLCCHLVCADDVCDYRRNFRRGKHTPSQDQQTGEKARPSAVEGKTAVSCGKCAGSYVSEAREKGRLSRPFSCIKKQAPGVWPDCIR